MTAVTISQGASATLSLAQGDFVALQNSASSKARLEISSGPQKNKVVAESHRGNSSYGPFEAVSVTVSAIAGSLTYDFGASPSVSQGGTPNLTSAQAEAVAAAIGDAVDLKRSALASASIESLDLLNRSATSTITGTYAGNGSATSVSLGWRPDFVVVKADSTETARFWSSASWYDRTDSLVDSESTGGGITPTESGFSLGAAASVNTNAVTYHYFAYKDNGSGQFLQSSHTGNGTAGRVLSTFAGIVLQWLGIKRDSAQSMVFAYKGLATSSDHNGVVAADAVIGGDGNVTLSASAKVNQWSVNLGEGTIALGVADDAADIKAVHYTGTGVARRISLPWLADWIFITPRGSTGGTGQMWFSSLAAGQHLPTGAGAVSTGRITSVDASGVVLSTAAQVNSNGIEFVLLAFRRSRRNPAVRRLPKLQHTKAVQLTSGGYIDCGVSDALKFNGAHTIEWLGAIYPASTTPFAGGAGVNDEANKQFPLISRSLGADAVSGNMSFCLAGLAPRPEGTGQAGGDWSGASIAWATFDTWELPQTSTPALDNFPAFSGIVMPFGELMHIVLSHDGNGGWYLMVNGRVVKERKRDLVAAIGKANIVGGTGHRTVIGGRRRASSIEFGHSQQVRLVRIYQRMLTVAEGIANFHAAYGLATATSGYLEEWDANKASGTSLPATVNSANNGTITNGIVV